jgi:hypothetical protein
LGVAVFFGRLRFHLDDNLHCSSAATVAVARTRCAGLALAEQALVEELDGRK